MRMKLNIIKLGEDILSVLFSINELSLKNNLAVSRRMAKEKRKKTNNSNDKLGKKVLQFQV
jgi:hypothetical protein